MTKTTEELKREMYAALEGLKLLIQSNCVPSTRTIHNFEDDIESYLEALRQEAEGLKLQGEVLRDAYTYQHEKTIEARTEADRERNRAQAFEFANKSAGELLQAANAKVKAQRQSIGQLKNDRNNAQSLAAANYEKYQKARKELSEARKGQGAIWIQSSDENATETKMDAAARRVACSFKELHKHYVGACPHCGFRRLLK